MLCWQLRFSFTFQRRVIKREWNRSKTILYYIHYTGAIDPGNSPDPISNPLAFANCGSSIFDVNLHAFQHDKDIYYRYSEIMKFNQRCGGMCCISTQEKSLTIYLKVSVVWIFFIYAYSWCKNFKYPEFSLSHFLGNGQ